MSQNKFIIFGAELTSKSPKLYTYTENNTGKSYLSFKEVIDSLHDVFYVEYEKIMLEMAYEYANDIGAQNDETLFYSKSKDELKEISYYCAEKGYINLKIYNVKSTEFNENFGVEPSKRSSLCVIVYDNNDNSSLKDIRSDVLDFVNDSFY
jgi:hypothetical protein